MKKRENKQAEYLRNFIFGVEDSLVSTVGLLSGVAIAGVPRATIFLAGVVLVFVEAFSMGVGSYLSQQSIDSFVQKAETHSHKSIAGAVIMWASYFFAGFIPLFPYLLLSVSHAFWVSILLALLSLFVLGMLAGRMAGINLLRQGLRMFIIGGIAILLGVAVGTFVNKYLITVM